MLVAATTGIAAGGAPPTARAVAVQVVEPGAQTTQGGSSGSGSYAYRDVVSVASYQVTTTTSARQSTAIAQASGISLLAGAVQVSAALGGHSRDGAGHGIPERRLRRRDRIRDRERRRGGRLVGLARRHPGHRLRDHRPARRRLAAERGRLPRVRGCPRPAPRRRLARPPGRHRGRSSATPTRASARSPLHPIAAARPRRRHLRRARPPPLRAARAASRCCRPRRCRPTSRASRASPTAAPRAATRHLPGGYSLDPPIDAATKAALLGPSYLFPLAGGARFQNDFGAPRADTRFNQGVDLFAPLGTPVLAVHDGTLVQVGWSNIGGRQEWLRDSDGNLFYYGHLSAYAPVAKTGAQVHAGDVIGFLGDSGDAQGTPFHLHFEIHPAGKWAVPPYAYVSAWLDNSAPLGGVDAGARAPGRARPARIVRHLDRHGSRSADRSSPPRTARPTSPAGTAAIVGGQPVPSAAQLLDPVAAGRPLPDRRLGARSRRARTLPAWTSTPQPHCSPSATSPRTA